MRGQTCEQHGMEIRQHPQSLQQEMVLGCSMGTGFRGTPLANRARRIVADARQHEGGLLQSVALWPSISSYLSCAGLLAVMLAQRVWLA